MSDNPLHAGHRPPPRLGTPGDLLFAFRDAQQRQVGCELRDHGRWGWEAQFWTDREFVLGRRFDTRALAEQWAQLERDTFAALTDPRPIEF